MTKTVDEKGNIEFSADHFKEATPEEIAYGKECYRKWKEKETMTEKETEEVAHGLLKCHHEQIAKLEENVDDIYSHLVGLQEQIAKIQEYLPDPVHSISPYQRGYDAGFADGLEHARAGIEKALNEKK